jgi:hypothetical protein
VFVPRRFRLRVPWREITIVDAALLSQRSVGMSQRGSCISYKVG